MVQARHCRASRTLENLPGTEQRRVAHQSLSVRSKMTTESFSAPVNRRSALKSMGALGVAAAVPGCATVASASAAQTGVTDADIFNFALNLESLETEYYMRGTTGRGMSDADAG